jgi:hypothetical protein
MVKAWSKFGARRASVRDTRLKEVMDTVPGRARPPPVNVSLPNEGVSSMSPLVQPSARMSF